MIIKGVPKWTPFYYGRMVGMKLSRNAGYH